MKILYLKTNNKLVVLEMQNGQSFVMHIEIPQLNK